MPFRSTIIYICLDLVSNLFAAFLVVNSCESNKPVPQWSAVCLCVVLYCMSIANMLVNLANEDYRKKAFAKNRALVAALEAHMEGTRELATAFAASQRRKRRKSSTTSSSGTGYDSEVTSGLLKDRSSSMRG